MKPPAAIIGTCPATGKKRRQWAAIRSCLRGLLPWSRHRNQYSSRSLGSQPAARHSFRCAPKRPSAGPRKRNSSENCRIHRETAAERTPRAAAGISTASSLACHSNGRASQRITGPTGSPSRRRLFPRAWTPSATGTRRREHAGRRLGVRILSESRKCLGTPAVHVLALIAGTAVPLGPNARSQAGATRAGSTPRTWWPTAS